MSNLKSIFLKLLVGAMAITFSSPALAKKNVNKKTIHTKRTETKIPADVTLSQIKWTGKKITGQHNGKISLKSGEFQVTGEQLNGGHFEIDMNSITVEDIKDDQKANASLVGHLKSDDFFGADKNPISKIVINKVVALEKPEATKSHMVTADLMIKGKTLPVEFPALIRIKNGSVTAKASVEVDRTKYGIKYNSGNFFKDLGDKVINDIFTVEIDVVSKTPTKVANN